MAGHHQIEIDPANAFVRLTMSGFYEPAEAFALAREFERAVADLGCVPNTHVTLADIRDMAIQSQAAVEAFMQVVGSPAIRSRKLAFVVARSLARMQARRLTSRPDVEFFETVAAAEAWLDVAVSGAQAPTPPRRLLRA